MEMVRELEALRTLLEEQNALLQKTFQSLDRAMEQCRAQDVQERQSTDEAPVFESIYPLCMDPSFFKGKAVVAVIFPDGVRRETPTWKKMVETVMKRCNDDADKHDVLMELRNRVQGRSRQLLGKRSAGMRSPIQIDKNLYMETHYDTESLLRIMTVRILDAVGYDYSGIQVAIRSR